MPKARKHSVLITGASGSLGRQLVAQLYFDKGVDFVMATGPEPKPHYFQEYSPKAFKYTQVNLRKSRQVRNLFNGDLFQEKKIDTVIHLAFKARVNDRNPQSSHSLNIDATRELLELSQKSDTVNKFIFRSSHQVYRLTSMNSVFVNEDSDLNFETSANQWIRDRVDADMLCRASMGSENLNVIVLRLSNLMGMNVKSQLYSLLQGAIAHTPMGYNPMVNLLHTKDAVRAFQLALHKDISGVFNINGRDTAPLSLIAELNESRHLPLPEPILPLINKLQRYIRATNYHFGIHGERLKYAALMDGKRAEKALHYTPLHHVELG